jgi:hypothetical protein
MKIFLSFIPGKRKKIKKNPKIQILFYVPKLSISILVKPRKIKIQ